MEKFPIVDTHVHLWHPKQLRYPWLAEVPTLNRPYLLKDYIAASGELAIESIVFVQCDTHPDDGLKETAWVTSLAAVEPRIQGIVAWAPLEEGEQVAPFIEKLAENPLVKGIRRLIQSRKHRLLCPTQLCQRCQSVVSLRIEFRCLYLPPTTRQCDSACRTVPACPIHFGSYRQTRHQESTF